MIKLRANLHHRRDFILIMSLAHAMGFTDYCPRCGSLHIKNHDNAHECDVGAVAMIRGELALTLPYAIFSGRHVTFYDPGNQQSLVNM